MFPLFCLMILPLPISTLFPYTTLFRSKFGSARFADSCLFREPHAVEDAVKGLVVFFIGGLWSHTDERDQPFRAQCSNQDRKSTRLNSSHTVISYAVFCLKKKNRYYGTS